MPTRAHDQVVARYSDQRTLRHVRSTSRRPIPVGVPGRTPPAQSVGRSMTNRPVFTRNWDPRRQAVCYKIALEGTHRFLLFSEDSMNDLLTQIEAVKGPNDATHT